VLLVGLWYLPMNLNQSELLIKNILVYHTVLLQFAMQVLTGGCVPPSLEERRFEMGPLCSSVVASYRLLMVTIGP